MINYIEFLNVPATIAIVLVGLFLVIQVIGELLEFKGKVVPEFAKIRKVFVRRKKERMLLQKMEKTIDQVQLTLDDLNQHYSTDNIRMRDEWMRLVNSKLEQYDKSISELGVKLDKNNSDTPVSYTHLDVYKRQSVNGMLAYFECYNDHKRVLRLRRLFYAIFGFSPERIENFRERGIKGEIHCS